MLLYDLLDIVLQLLDRQSFIYLPLFNQEKENVHKMSSTSGWIKYWLFGV